MINIVSMRYGWRFFVGFPLRGLISQTNAHFSMAHNEDNVKMLLMNGFCCVCHIIELSLPFFLRPYANAEVRALWFFSLLFFCCLLLWFWPLIPCWLQHSIRLSKVIQFNSAHFLHLDNDGSEACHSQPITETIIKSNGKRWNMQYFAGCYGALHS